MLKNGDLGFRGDQQREQRVLPVPGEPTISTPFGMRSAQL